MSKEKKSDTQALAVITPEIFTESALGPAFEKDVEDFKNYYKKQVQSAVKSVSTSLEIINHNLEIVIDNGFCKIEGEDLSKNLRQIRTELAMLNTWARQNAVVAAIAGVANQRFYAAKRKMLVDAISFIINDVYKGVLFSQKYVEKNIAAISKFIHWNFSDSDKLEDLLKGATFDLDLKIDEYAYNLFFPHVWFSNMFFTNEKTDKEKLAKCNGYLSSKFNEIMQALKENYKDKKFKKNELNLFVADYLNGPIKLEQNERCWMAEYRFVRRLEFDGYIRKTKEYTHSREYTTKSGKTTSRRIYLYELNLEKFAAIEAKS